MSKKLNFFPQHNQGYAGQAQNLPQGTKPPTKHELIAASEYGKAPEYIARLAVRLAFLREKEVQDV
jgi:hypothetical protein